MEPIGRDQRRHRDDRHHKSHSRRHLDHTNGYDQRAPAVLDRRRYDDAPRDSTDSKNKDTMGKEGSVSRYGPLLVAAGLGFGAGYLFADPPKSRLKGGKLSYKPETGHASSIGASEEWQDRRGLEYWRLNDRLALTGPRARGRSTSRSAHSVPLDEAEYAYWR
ncbi:unnamed protein product [Discula destructiva]